MKKFISLMNPYTFYYIWNSKYKYYLENLIEEVIYQRDIYKLVNTFNNNTNNLRSYIFLESNDSLIYIDFNRNNKFIDQYFIIYNYLKITSSKKIIVIIFNNIKNNKMVEGNIYQIFKNEKNSDFLKLFLSTNYKEQNLYPFKELIDYLYETEDEFTLNYLREEKFLI